MKKLLILISVFMLLIVAFNEIAQANTGRHYMRIGRLWVIAEYDGAEGWSGQYAWPGGRVRYPNGNIQELWGANVRKLGTTAGCRNWTGPDGTLFAYWTSGMYRTYDYDILGQSNSSDCPYACYTESGTEMGTACSYGGWS